MSGMLSREEERNLVLRWRAGDKKALARLIDMYNPFLTKIARSMNAPNAQFDDLMQEGRLGMVEAMQSFDVDRGYGLAALARFYVASRMRLFVSGNSGPVKIPKSRKIREGFHRVLRQIRLEDLALDHPLPTARKIDICAEHGVTFREFEVFERAIRIPSHLGRPEEGGVELVDMGFRLDVRIVEEASVAKGREIIMEAMMVLSVRSIEILGLRYFGESPMSLDRVAERLGLSRERVRKIERRALAELKDALAARGVGELSDLIG